MQQIQRLKLHTETNSETYGFAVLENSDFVVSVINKKVSVLVPNGDGTFRIDMQTQNTLSNLYVPWRVDGNAMAYKDGKLAFAIEDNDESNGMRNSVSYDIVILDASGMQLYANYQSSLQNNHLENYDKTGQLEKTVVRFSSVPCNFMSPQLYKTFLLYNCIYRLCRVRIHMFYKTERLLIIFSYALIPCISTTTISGGLNKRGFQSRSNPRPTISVICPQVY